LSQGFGRRNARIDKDDWMKRPTTDLKKKGCSTQHTSSYAATNRSLAKGCSREDKRLSISPTSKKLTGTNRLQLTANAQREQRSVRLQTAPQQEGPQAGWKDGRGQGLWQPREGRGNKGPLYAAMRGRKAGNRHMYRQVLHTVTTLQWPHTTTTATPKPTSAAGAQCQGNTTGLSGIVGAESASCTEGQSRHKKRQQL